MRLIKHLLITPIILFLLSFSLLSFGKAASNLSIATNPFRYSSAYTDPESHQQYLNARYYQPKFSRFISRDSYRLLNRYSYVDGNPVMYSDPSGHDKLATGLFLGTNIVFGLGAASEVGIGLHALSKKMYYTAGSLILTGALAVAATIANVIAYQSQNADTQSKWQNAGNGLMMASAVIGFFGNATLAVDLKNASVMRSRATSATDLSTDLVKAKVPSQAIWATRLNALSAAFQMSSMALTVAALKTSGATQQYLQDAAAGLLGLALITHGLVYRQALKLEQADFTVETKPLMVDTDDANKIGNGSSNLGPISVTSSRPPEDKFGVQSNHIEE